MNPETISFSLERLTAPIQFSNSINLMLTLSVISLVPFFLISVTSFLRCSIVLSMIRTAMGTQQAPPNSVVVSLAMFLTIFIMSPVWHKINEDAIKPYNAGKLTQQQMFDTALEPLRQFMFRQTRENDLALFVDFANIKNMKDYHELPTWVLIPSYMISELRTSFEISFLIFLPFLVVDLVIANLLLSLGMFMLSPVIVSLPFKIMLFVLVDGWNLIARGLMASFYQ